MRILRISGSFLMMIVLLFLANIQAQASTDTDLPRMPREHINRVVPAGSNFPITRDIVQLSANALQMDFYAFLMTQDFTLGSNVGDSETITWQPNTTYRRFNALGHPGFSIGGSWTNTYWVGPFGEIAGNHYRGNMHHNLQLESRSSWDEFYTDDRTIRARVQLITLNGDRAFRIRFSRISAEPSTNATFSNHLNVRAHTHMNVWGGIFGIRYHDVSNSYTGLRLSAWNLIDLNENGLLAPPEEVIPNIDYDRQFVNFGTALNQSSVLSMSQMNNTIEGDNLGLWTIDGNIRQTFRLMNVPEKGENVYQIFNHSQHILLAWNKTTNNSSQVFMHRNENKPEHYWILEKQRDGSYVIANYADNNMVLDVTNSNTSNGTRVQIYPRNGTKAQQWMISTVERPIL